ncbi:MAG: hypothetical protein M3395_01090 [Chloroflexota bacterium]|nr:hypothetical protein [Chloroflexota bacterium]
MAGHAADAAALRVLGDLTRRSPIEPGGEPPVPWLESGVAITELEAQLERAGAAAAHLIAAAADRPLAREMEPWARKLEAWVATSRGALLVEDGASDQAGTATALERTLALPHRVSDEAFEAFVRRCLADAPGRSSPMPGPSSPQVDSEP